MIHIDTHIVVWLWAKDERRLKPLRRILEKEDLAYSPMVELELEYLFETGRTRMRASVVLQGLTRAIGLVRSNTSFGAIVDEAKQISWTRDPFDRLIVGNAIADGVEILTQDRTILKYCSIAINR